MASDIWLRTILIVRKETRCRHIGYSYRLTVRVLLYAPSHRQDSTYHSLCYTSRGGIHIHTHTYTHTDVYTCTHKYVYIYICSCVDLNTCSYMSLYCCCVLTSLLSLRTLCSKNVLVVFCAVWGILLPNTSFLESFFPWRWSSGLQLNEEVFSMAEEITQQHFLIHLFYSENKEGKKEMFYLTTHATHVIYGYMASDIWLRPILIVIKETHCRHIGYSFRLTARVL